MSRAAAAQVRVRHTDSYADRWYDVDVPTPNGTVVVPVHYDAMRDVLSIDVSGELLAQATEAVTVAVQLAFRAIAEDRHG